MEIFCAFHLKTLFFDSEKKNFSIKPDFEIPTVQLRRNLRSLHERRRLLLRRDNKYQKGCLCPPGKFKKKLKILTNFSRTQRRCWFTGGLFFNFIFWFDLCNVVAYCSQFLLTFSLFVILILFNF